MEEDGKGIQHMQRQERMQSMAVAWDHHKGYGGDTGTGFTGRMARGEAEGRQGPCLGVGGGASVSF